MKLASILAFVLIISVVSAKAQTPGYQIEPLPAWKKPIAFEQAKNDYSKSGENSYLLVDWQDNEIKSEYCYRYVTRLNNENGVQNNSQLYFNFDPSYQKLSINKICIYRNKQVIDQLKAGNIEVMRNEQNIDRLMYDGTYSAVVILKDVRIGDILEYAYTIKGKNPIYGNHVYRSPQLAFAEEIEELYQSTCVPASQQVQYKLLGGASEPKVTESNGQKLFEWHLKNVQPIFSDELVPAWYQAYPEAEISSFGSWDQVRQWERQLFPLDISVPAVDRFLKDENIGRSQADLMRVIRFVQKDIRYLGMEMGVFSHKPHHPEKILGQRFGDCKDKSYLLAVMLRRIGVEAWPALVSMQLTKSLSEHLPSSLVFDHVIVKFSYQGKTYWVDATDSQQAGGLEQLCFPELSWALVIDESKNGLEPIPVQQLDRVKIDEHYWIPDSAGEATFEVTTTYFGGQANQQRSRHQANSIYQSRDNYLKFYSSYFNQISWESDSALQLTDRTETNEFVTKERFKLNKLWEKRDDTKDELYASFNPYNLYDYLSYTKDHDRSMPLSLQYPIRVDHTLTIHFPSYKVFNLKNETDSISNSCFRFVRKQTLNKAQNRCIVQFTYETKTDAVPVDQLKTYFTDYDKLSDLCDLSLYWGMTGSSAATLAWRQLLTAVLFIVGFGFFLSQSYRFNLGTKAGSKAEPVGGWMILPLIGLHIVPLFILSVLIRNNYFTQSGWEAVQALNPDRQWLCSFTFYFEMLCNIAVIMASVFLLTLAYKRRTTFPILYIWFRVFSLAFLIADELLLYRINGTSPDIQAITRELVMSCVWIPYFALSERVADCFTLTYRPKGDNQELAVD